MIELFISISVGALAVLTAIGLFMAVVLIVLIALAALGRAIDE